MPVTRKLITQDNHDENQWLRVDHDSRFVTNDTENWQCVFGPQSGLSVGDQVIKIAAEYDTATLDNLKLTAYLYNPSNGTVDSGGTCFFNLYLVKAPDWTEQFVTVVPGTALVNNYFYAHPTANDLLPIDLFGSDTIMIEAVIVRLSNTFRDRVYINHLGIYNNVFKLRQDVEFLDITKVDE